MYWGLGLGFRGLRLRVKGLGLEVYLGFRVKICVTYFQFGAYAAIPSEYIVCLKTLVGMLN